MKEVSKYDGIPLFSVANGLLDRAMQANTMLYLDISKIPKTPFQSEIFSVIVDWSIFFHMYSPFRTKTPSQSEIFSVIVDWSIFSYVFHLSGPLHPPNWVWGRGSGCCPLYP